MDVCSDNLEKYTDMISRAYHLRIPGPQVLRGNQNKVNPVDLTDGTLLLI